MNGISIAVDLTPVLPGGENGGAKIFVLELIRRLAILEPGATFILLTQHRSHEELAALDAPNVRRLLVIGPSTGKPGMALRPKLITLARRVLPHLPTRLRRLAGRVGYKLNNAFKRRATSRSLLSDLGVSLLFCPFTAPTFFEIGIPTVCTIYDLQYKTHPEFFDPADVANRDHTFLEACKRATGMAAISDYSRTTAINTGNIDPDRIQTIYLRMAQRIDSAAGADAPVLHRLNLLAQQYLLFPANFWRHKNHEMLLTAFGMACQAGLPAGIKLVCTGAPGARQKFLQEAVVAMHLSDRIVFPGFLPNAEIAALMANCRGVIFPSLYEGFGLPVVEAMAAGVPVACSNLTSLPEVAGDAAILFDPRVPDQIASAILRLVEDEVLRIELRSKGAVRAAEFADADWMAKEYIALFNSSLGRASTQLQLTGVYPDGWAGHRVCLNVPPSSVEQHLEIEFVAPEWLLHKQTTVQLCSSNKCIEKPLIVMRGKSVLFKAPVSTAGGTFDFSITPSFTPANLGMQGDEREIAIKVSKCQLTQKNGDRIQLWSASMETT